MSAMDTTPLGELAANVMGKIADRYGEDCFVRTAALVVEVDAGDATDILVACTDDRAWTQIAFIEEAVRTLVKMCDEAEADSE